MSPIGLLYLLLAVIVGSWVIFALWTLRRPPPAHFIRPVLAFVCEPSDDPEITCFFCGRPAVDLEFTYRTHDRTVTAGLHEECRRNPRHLSLAAADLRSLIR